MLDSKKLGIFVGYVILWVSSHLLIYGSRQPGAPTYNATSVVLLTDLIKFVMAAGLYLILEGSVKDLVQAGVDNWLVLIKQSVPAGLYVLYNNLVYINLGSFDPGSYIVLMQFKLALTGVIYQIAFGKSLNRNQWLAVLLITVGCMCMEGDKIKEGFTHALQMNLSSWTFMLGQICCTVFAGVYTEAVLKGDQDAQVSTHLQNVFIYLECILGNVIYLSVQGTFGEAMSIENASVVFSPTVLLIIALMSSAGLVTGFFLKHLDPLVKSVATDLEIVATMGCAFLLFGSPFTNMRMAAVLIVICGVALYSRPRSSPTAPRSLQNAEPAVKPAAAAAENEGEWV